MRKKDNRPVQSSKTAFDYISEVSVNGKTYIIERHFTGKRSYRKAIFAVVENEVKREKLLPESA